MVNDKPKLLYFSIHDNQCNIKVKKRNIVYWYDISGVNRKQNHIAIVDSVYDTSFNKVVIDNTQKSAILPKALKRPNRGKRNEPKHSNHLHST